MADNKKKSSASLIKKDNYRKDEDVLSAKYGVGVKISGRSLTFKCKNEKELQELISKL